MLMRLQSLQPCLKSCVLAQGSMVTVEAARRRTVRWRLAMQIIKLTRSGIRPSKTVNLCLNLRFRVLCILATCRAHRDYVNRL